MQAYGAKRTASFLLKDYYVIRTAPSRRPRGSTAARQAYFDRHIAYQLALEASGRLFAAGPVFDQQGKRTGGMIIIRAKSFKVAKRIADADPHHASKLWSYEIQRWRLSEGSYTVTVKYSSKSASVL
jgi:uncharacterized protein YciI